MKAQKNTQKNRGAASNSRPLWQRLQAYRPWWNSVRSKLFVKAKKKRPDPRPLSPHLQVYRPQWTSVLSILHRACGVVLLVAAVLLAFWVVGITLDDAAGYQFIQPLLHSWPGRVLLFLWTLCNFYHMCNGIRHLCWDCGWGLELKSALRSGVAVVSVAVTATLIVWFVVL